MDKTICELFAGVGGFSQGFYALHTEWNVVWYSEFDTLAHRCYALHNGLRKDKTGDKFKTFVDINDITKANIPEHTLLAFGAPCQDFSVLATTKAAKGLNGKNGGLWWQALDVIKAKRPPFILMENVARIILSPNKDHAGADFAVIITSLAKLGYTIEWRKVCAADYGAATRRTSAYIFAYRNDTNYAWEQSALVPEDILLSKGMMAQAFPVKRLKSTKTLSFPLDAVKEFYRDAFNFRFDDAGIIRGFKATVATVIPDTIPAIPLKDILQRDVPDEYLLTDDQRGSMDKLKKKTDKDPRENEDGQKYTYSEGAIPFPDDLDKPARTIVTSEGNVSRCSHVVLDPQKNKLRWLTPEETERIMGFEEGWTADMSERNRYKCMGNAVVVPMITRMAAVIDNIVSQEV